jgi:hypothetical protein
LNENNIKGRPVMGVKNQIQDATRDPVSHRGEQIGKVPFQNPDMADQIGSMDNEVEKKLFLAFYEIVMILFVVIFILSGILGKNTNQGLATKWYTANQQFFEDNYAHIGVSTEYNTKAGVPILKESYNNFKFYASGRVFLKWMLVNMEVNYKYIQI